METYDLVGLPYAPPWLLQQFLCKLNARIFDEKELRDKVTEKILRSQSELVPALQTLRIESEHRTNLLRQLAEQVTTAVNVNHFGED